jgi:arsenate reductase (thioredoxin)
MKSKQVLILCTGNSARSILAEFLLRAKGKGRFAVRSAGSHPTGTVNPLTVKVLQEKYGIQAADARSKSWDEFKDTPFDLVITVCDHARETCPLWPGQPLQAHWGSPDPAAVTGSEAEKYRAFVDVASQISRRIDLLLALPEDKVTSPAMRDIGHQFRLGGAADPAR